MNYKIEYSKKSAKYLKKLSRKTQLRIIKAINSLPEGDTKKLRGNDNLYRLRIGQWRIIFEKTNFDFIISILEITPRGDAYDNV